MELRRSAPEPAVAARAPLEERGVAAAADEEEAATTP
jgi:hypothetical protein